METDSWQMGFIDEPIEVHFYRPPMLSKTPPCPDAFTWREELFAVAEMLAEWVDFRRRGRAARNMQPGHLASAARRGSWGVGRFYFRVRTEGGRVFELYFDRTPGNADDRAGHWVLFGERKQIIS